MTDQNIDPQFQAGLDEAEATKDARIAELESQVGSLTFDRDQHAERADKNAAAVDDADRAIKQLKADLAKAEKAAKASVTKGERVAKPRKLEPILDGLSGSALDEALTKADADGKTVEIAFSDGRREIAGIPPTIVVGDVWRPHTLGKMLRDPVCVQGAAADGGSFAIAGYALLIDGKPVAYTARSEPINVAPGRQVSLADDIYF